ncbi:MAG TPA: pseudouridine-5'-phosphate glycosidase [Pyrinomonadaceae bacterium]|nr:pseudouridine-5'-phosphate glycosidase [Pyrinomonadaceae bacterium]
MKLHFSDEVSGALHFERPIVALESTVIAHGLPFPRNIETAYKLERIIRERDVTPATIALFDGEIHVGINDEQIETLATSGDIIKLSVRDLPGAISFGKSGATTVAATATIAKLAGIRVFATGGIGGVHRGGGHDISADLLVLARTPLVVVCSGAKSILDIEATREALETLGITVLGWQCDELPGFYSRSAKFRVDQRVEDAREAAAIVLTRDNLGLNSAILLTVQVPEASALDSDEIEVVLETSMKEAENNRVSGKEVTPFLLASLEKATAGKTLEANISLLENNARVAAEVAKAVNQAVSV